MYIRFFVTLPFYDARLDNYAVKIFQCPRIFPNTPISVKYLCNHNELIIIAILCFLAALDIKLQLRVTFC